VWAETSDTPLDANVLRVLFESAETGFDPARTSDLYSSRVESHIFEPLLSYDPLAIPVRVVPCTADALPEASADFRTWTLRVRPGIYFTDDPAFRGQRRELVAADYVYSFKRIYDPVTKSPAYSSLHEDGIVGLEALRERALRAAHRSTIAVRSRASARSIATRCNSSSRGRVRAS
jgi:ABC-type transport system substrate-binding protein